LANCPGGVVSFTGLPVFDPHEDLPLTGTRNISWFDLHPANVAMTAFLTSFPIKSLGPSGRSSLGEFTATSVTGYYELQSATGLLVRSGERN